PRTFQWGNVDQARSDSSVGQSGRFARVSSTGGSQNHGQTDSLSCFHWLHAQHTTTMCMAQTHCFHLFNELHSSSLNRVISVVVGDAGGTMKSDEDRPGRNGLASIHSVLSSFLRIFVVDFHRSFTSRCDALKRRKRAT